MSERFGFDPKTLTNDELFNRQLELISRKMQAGRLGRMDIAAQLDVMIQAIDAERRERMMMERWALVPSSPVVVETDPDMREQQVAKEIETTAKPAKEASARPQRRVIRSDTPVIPTNGS